MEVRIFTLPFDAISQGFPDEIIAEFCLNKKVHSMQIQFFLNEGHPYWSVAVQYDILVKGEEKLRDLDDAQQLLFKRLKEWRKQQSEKDGMPAYILATDRQLKAMIMQKVQTLEGLKQAKGFGQKRIQKYGKAILNILKVFYEEQQNVPAKTDTKLPF
jgi:superfamily II DNA helicase RecQ